MVTAMGLGKKLTAPYRHAPAVISMKRIDAALAIGAQAEIQSPGRGGYKSTSVVTLRTLDGRVVDSWTVQGNIRSAHRFVASYNRAGCDDARDTAAWLPGAAASLNCSPYGFFTLLKGMPG